MPLNRIPMDMVEGLTSQLADIATKTGWLNPDDYTGTDASKLQQAITDSLTNHKNVVINRFYDITGSSITLDIPLAYKPYRPIIIGLNGGIIKNDSGIMFTSTRIAFGLSFQNVTFQSTSGSGTTVFNGDYMFWVTSMNCRYINCDSVIKNFDSSAGYIQCFRTIGDIVRGGAGYAFDFNGSYDCSFNNLSIEDRDGGIRHNFVGSNRVNTNLRIRDSVIEGLNLVGIIIQDTHTCTIDNVFFEANLGGHMQLGSSTSGAFLRGLIVSECRAGDSVSRSYPLIKWTGLIQGAISRNNSSSLINLHDATNVTTGWIDSKNDLYEGSATVIDPNNRIKMANNTVTTTTTADSGSKTVMLYDDFKKIVYTKSITVATGITLNTFGMDEIVNRDSVISIQVPNSLVYTNEHSMQSNQQTLQVSLNNTSGASATFTIYITILKFKYSITG